MLDKIKLLWYYVAMKQFIGKHKLTVAVTLLGVLAIPSMTAFNIVSADEAQKNFVAFQAEEKQSVAKVETPTTEVAPATEAPVAPPVETQPVVMPEPAPVVLSTQEYAVKYLGIDNQFEQLCLDTIVNMFPERFTPDVRERNIKALTVFANICSSGRLGANNTFNPTLILAMGRNGEWFDSQLAKSHW